VNGVSDDIHDIAVFYDSDPGKERGRLDRHQLEYELTWRYLPRYLPPRSSILEVGAATGKYTLELAKRGYPITAVDLSAALLAQCRDIIHKNGLEGQVRFVAADARDLREAGEREFDAVLMMGPLYHLVAEADRKAAVKEAFTRLRKGGIIFSSFLSRYGVVGDLLKENPDWIEVQAEVRSFLEKGRRPDDSPRGGFRGYFALLAEITPLHEAMGFETLTLAGVDPAISADDESFNKLQGTQRQRWLDLLLEISTEQSTLGASRHLLYIGRKP
jgi:SAM-dependent methyltransferase